MENILVNKAKFFAQYWGQCVYLMPNGEVTSFISLKLNEHEKLELKSLSSITDEDVIQGVLFIYNKSIEDLGEIVEVKHYDTFSGVTSIGNGNNFKTHRSIHHWEGSPKIGSRESDYFRSKGYALSWMGLSVEKLIEYGWIKIK